MLIALSGNGLTGGKSSSSTQVCVSAGVCVWTSDIVSPLKRSTRKQISCVIHLSAASLTSDTQENL